VSKDKNDDSINSRSAFVNSGTYLNPSNNGFAESLRSKIYVDKSELISYTNSVLRTQQKFVCVSRPRRFGKTMAAQMLVAYYSRGCSSKKLFSNLAIAKDKSYTKHLNKYNVIFLNMQRFLSNSDDIEDMKAEIKDTLLDDICDRYPDFYEKVKSRKADYILDSLYRLTGIPFVIVIDEWDCVFRVSKIDSSGQEKYLEFLRIILKDQEYVALVYMTGILPIKKMGGHSELNMFDEFTMTNPRELATFVGFTHDEVLPLCSGYGMDYEEIFRWYNGYKFAYVKSVYNPRSVVAALLSKICDNYWSSTETFEALSVYFKMNFDGLKDTIVQLLTSEKKNINIGNFSNDMVTFKTYEDVLTLLIHLGYLGYDFNTQEVFIPNKEISSEFENAIRDAEWHEIINVIRESNNLLKATWGRNSDIVANIIDKTHNETSHIQYNDENALSYVVSLAYYSAKEFYELIREMPAGKGFADLIYKPRKNHLDKPAMIIELKWNKSASTAIDQIKNKNYPQALSDYNGNILLVGINYNKKTKKHECVIENSQPV